jgi:hypothetical protein
MIVKSIGNYASPVFERNGEKWARCNECENMRRNCEWPITGVFIEPENLPSQDCNEHYMPISVMLMCGHSVPGIIGDM